MGYEIPPFIKIKGKRVEILWSDDLDPNGADNLGRITHGEWRPNESQIVLRKGKSESETLKTFIHEILHGISDTYDPNLTHASINKYETIIWRLLHIMGLIEPQRKKKKNGK